MQVGLQRASRNNSGFVGLQALSLSSTPLSAFHRWQQAYQNPL